MIQVRAKATRAVVDVDGVPCRVWVAETIGGVKPGAQVTLYVLRVAAREDEPPEVLDGLDEQPLPDFGNPESRLSEAFRRMQDVLPDRHLIVHAIDTESGGALTVSQFPAGMTPGILRELADLQDADLRAEDVGQ